MKRPDQQPGKPNLDGESESLRPTEPGWRPEIPIEETPSMESPGGASPVRSGSASSGVGIPGEVIPPRIGPYEVIEELGRGGMGQVFLARQDEPVEREVAVKILRAASSPSGVSVTRFEAEQQSLARVAHPNVAQIFDAGVTAAGLPFLVMEFVPGQNICQYAYSRALDMRTRLRLFLPVCEAVQHAHRRGVIHRDLKPSNVLVLETGGQPIPKVIDFGLAKLMHDGPDLTRADAMLGTPGYMSPEQIFGDSQAIDTRSDVYSLGAVLYELLSDCTPFDISRDNIARLFETVSSQEPERPSRRAPQERASFLAEDLDWVVLKALARDPAERYGSVDALAEDLRAVLDERPVMARRPTVGYRVRKWCQRHRGAVMMGSLAALVTVFAFGWSLYSRWQNAEQTHLAQRLGEEVARFENLLRFAHSIPLHDLKPTKTQIRRRVGAFEGELAEAGRQAEGPLSYAVGRALLALGEPVRARSMLDRAWKSGYETPETALALGEAMSMIYRREREVAVAIRNKSQREARLQHLDDAYRQPLVGWLERGSEASSGSADLAVAQLAFFEERFDEALAAVDRSLEYQPWLYEALVLRAEVHRQLANEARLSGEFAVALGKIEAALGAYRQAARLGESDPEALAGECSLAIDTVIIDTRGSVPVEGLEEIVSGGLEACRHAIEADSELSTSWGRLAALYRHWSFNIIRKRREIDPLPLLGEAVAAAQQALELDATDAEAWSQLGRTHRELFRIGADSEEGSFDNLETAVEALEKALELAPERASIATGVATVYSDLARRAEAEGLDAGPFYDRAESGFERALSLVPDHVMYYNLGILLRLRSRWEIGQGNDPMPFFARAIEAYKESIALNDNYPWADNNLGYVHMQRADWLLQIGGDPSTDLDAAEAAMIRAQTIRDGMLDSSGNLAIIDGHRARWAWLQGEDPEPFWLRALGRFTQARIELISDNLSIDPRWSAMLSNVVVAWADYALESGEEVASKVRLLEKAAASAQAEGDEVEALFIDARAHLFASRWLHRRGESEAARVKLEAFEASARELLERAPKDVASELIVARLWLWRAKLATDAAAKRRWAEAGLEVLAPRPPLAFQAVIEGSLELERACAASAAAESSGEATTEALGRARLALERAREINKHLESKVAPLLTRAGSATGC